MFAFVVGVVVVVVVVVAVVVGVAAVAVVSLSVIGLCPVFGLSEIKFKSKFLVSQHAYRRKNKNPNNYGV